MILVYILYDSMHNTVFAGQVWNMLLKFLSQKNYQNIILISFEVRQLEHNYCHPNIQIIQIKRTRYLGRLSLILNFFKLLRYLPKTSYQIMARGPFAGYLAIKIKQLCLIKPKKIIIQARGLAGVEYAYSHQPLKPIFFTKWLRYINKPCMVPARHSFNEVWEPVESCMVSPVESIRFIYKSMLVKSRKWQLSKLEKTVYSYQEIIIECVSTALQDYLINNFRAYKNNLIVAQNDLPTKIKPGRLASWRKTLRLKFKINLAAQVYCYSGSAHAWQCPAVTIDFFKQKLLQDPQAFLLVLTNEPAVFRKLIEASQICHQNYLVLSIPYQEIYQYLAMADYGLLFREAHILNWVARPTKALEYASANLPIIHNQTIAWLANKKNPARI